MKESANDRCGQTGDEVHVLFVEKKVAKQVKNKLEEVCLLNKNYRLKAADSSFTAHNTYIAVPLQDGVDELELESLLKEIDIEVHGFGIQFCPYSTSLLGNHNIIPISLRKNSITSNNQHENSALSRIHLTLVQSGVLKAFTLFLEDNNNLFLSDQQQEDHLIQLKEKMISELDIATCPRTLQYLGDDKTLIIPLKAFDFTRDESLHNFIMFGTRPSGDDNNEPKKQQNQTDKQEEVERFVANYLWKGLANVFNSHRVVRRGEISPDSKIRLSAYKILWPVANDISHQTVGPGSPGWITVTEQGIRQSFDLTKVMFSRGNITEKIRFGKLVQPGEIVLDMYAGIGYFTLPALVHGCAEHVYCCEWNEEAVKALRFNLKDNDVHYRATVLVGDCRKVVLENNLVNKFDRISLGLLPSSEGGWRTAIKALRASTGGWLHVHGNVPVHEVSHWALWMSSQLRSFVIAEEHITNHGEWIVLVVHIEKVKSFAPTVNHYVADVFVGPRTNLLRNPASHIQNAAAKIIPGSAGVLKKCSELCVCQGDVPAPSCALSPGGVLHQEWMRNADLVRFE